MNEMSTYTSLSNYTRDNTLILIFIENLRNSFIPGMLKARNVIMDTTKSGFLQEGDSATAIFYVLLGVYLLFVLCQTVFGYFLLLAADNEANLFLAIPSGDCRELQKRCVTFMSDARVSFSR
ncbi:MAG: hypothetical protein P4M11_04475 [Candidatus Pacebacteria bacterium]|nr:hypothetical protein [Candidatus Paceibacterota bacterium]